MIGDILRRAEPLFRRDKKEVQDRRHREMIKPLEQQLATLEAQFESDDSPEVVDAYERLWGQLDELKRMQMGEDGDDITPEWTALKQAIGELPPVVGQHQTPNLRLVIDAIERLKAEGQWDESLLHDELEQDRSAAK